MINQPPGTPQPIAVPPAAARSTPPPRDASVPTDLDFVNANDGWMIVSGQIRATTDGGASWRTVYSGPASAERLDFLNAQDGWATFSGGVLRTTNGGASWQTLSGPALGSLDFVGPTTGFALVGPDLRQTVDGGQIWSPVTVPFPLRAVCFGSAEDGWALPAPVPSSAAGTGAPADTLLRTTDGGASWSQVRLPAPGTIACGVRGGVYLFASAPVLPSASMPPNVYTLTLDHSATGAAWTDLGALRSSNGTVGPPWSGLVPSATGGAVLAEVDFHSVGQARASLVSAAGTTVADVPVSLAAHWQTVADFASPDDGWIATTAAAGGWTLAATTDGGRSWRTVSTTVPLAPAWAIAFATPAVGYGLGSTVSSAVGAVLRTADGGRTWRQVGQLPLTAGNARPSVSFLTVEDGWALQGSRLWVTTDGGANWSVVAAQLPLTHDVGSSPAVDFVNPEDGCVGTGFPSGQLYYLMTTDGGSAWRAVHSPALSLWGCAQMAAGMTGATAPFCRQEGATWATLLQPLGYGPSYSGPMPLFSGGDQTVAWTACDTANGMALFVSGDGGRSWTAHRLSGPLQSTRFSFATAQDGWDLSGGVLWGTTDGGGDWLPALASANTSPPS